MQMKYVCVLKYLDRCLKWMFCENKFVFPLILIPFVNHNYYQYFLHLLNFFIQIQRIYIWEVKATARWGDKEKATHNVGHGTTGSERKKKIILVVSVHHGITPAYIVGVDSLILRLLLPSFPNAGIDSSYNKYNHGQT